jgi:hypothetical protein
MSALRSSLDTEAQEAINANKAVDAEQTWMKGMKIRMWLMLVLMVAALVLMIVMVVNMSSMMSMMMMVLNIIAVVLMGIMLPLMLPLGFHPSSNDMTSSLISNGSGNTMTGTNIHKEVKIIVRNRMIAMLAIDVADIVLMIIILVMMSMDMSMMMMILMVISIALMAVVIPLTLPMLFVSR